MRLLSVHVRRTTTSPKPLPACASFRAFPSSASATIPAAQSSCCSRLRTITLQRRRRSRRRIIAETRLARGGLTALNRIRGHSQAAVLGTHF